MECRWKQCLFKVVAKRKVDEGTRVLGEEQLLVDIVNVLDFVFSGGPILTIRTNCKLSPHACPIPLFNQPSGLRPSSRNYGGPVSTKSKPCRSRACAKSWELTCRFAAIPAEERHPSRPGEGIQSHSLPSATNNGPPPRTFSTTFLPTDICPLQARKAHLYHIT